jgi:iron complex transport system substrate-binding protein
LRKVGKMLGVEGKADQVAASLEKRVNDVRAKTKGLSKPTVFFEIYNQPLMTAGKKTVIDQMITYAGGKNLGATAGEQYPEYSPEKLVEANPDIYFATSGSMTNPADVSKRPGYSAVKAVKDGKVYVVEENLFVRSGPRIVDGLELLAKKIHPEAFKKSQ